MIKKQKKKKSYHLTKTNWSKAGLAHFNKYITKEHKQQWVGITDRGNCGFAFFLFTYLYYLRKIWCTCLYYKKARRFLGQNFHYATPTTRSNVFKINHIMTWNCVQTFILWAQAQTCLSLKVITHWIKIILMIHLSMYILSKSKMC